MSSESGESHTSAPNGDDVEAGVGSIAPDSPIESRTGAGQGGIAQDSTLQEEEQQELESLDNGSNGMTFARHRAQKDTYEDESGSELVMRSAARRPQSLESASTPDDTPSIQVGLRTCE